MDEHEEFVELCALHSSGAISNEQSKRLRQHLEKCFDCRRVLGEFQEIVSMGLPALAPDFAALTGESEEQAAGDRAEHRLLARIENEVLGQRQPGATAEAAPSKPLSVSLAFGFARRLLPYAAALILATSVGFYSYDLGVRRSTRVSEPKLAQVQTQAGLLQTQMAELSSERAALRAKLQDSNGKIENLTSAVNARMAEIASLKEGEKRLAEAAEGAESKRAAADAERATISRKLADAMVSLDATQRSLAAARDERVADLVQVASLEQRLQEAANELKDRDQTIQQQRDMLAYDRDIRELIGARDLYVAEVNDVDRNANITTPFGRVFFTKGKSLIFYAYDLDRQPGLKRAAVFQAWGRRGSDFEQALPLGMMYLDSSSNRRWVLRFDDSRTIAKIDAVFVTVEPRAGSRKPSGKPLLFAYLKVAPNHP